MNHNIHNNEDFLFVCNDENISEIEQMNLKIREAVRCVLFDTDNNVAVLYSRAKNYWALPGGGIEKGETPEVATMREMREEAGCDSENLVCVGKTKEIRKDRELINISYAFKAYVVGEKGVSEFEEHEEIEDFVVEWHSIDDVHKKIASVKTREQRHENIKQRDLAIIDAVRNN